VLAEVDRPFPTPDIDVLEQSCTREGISVHERFSIRSRFEIDDDQASVRAIVVLFEQAAACPHDVTSLSKVGAMRGAMRVANVAMISFVPRIDYVCHRLSFDFCELRDAGTYPRLSTISTV
jgi:hypothetical protein